MIFYASGRILMILQEKTTQRVSYRGLAAPEPPPVGLSPGGLSLERRWFPGQEVGFPERLVSRTLSGDAGWFPGHGL